MNGVRAFAGGLIPFLIAFFGLGVFGHAVHAQQPPELRRIAFLGPSAVVPPALSPLDLFRKSLAELGYEEGRDIVINARWPGSDRLDQMTETASALVKLKPAVLVAVGATAARAAKAVTSEVPLVFEVVVDTVATGLVPSTERPEGNATGSTTFDPGLPARQFEILKSVVPNLGYVAVLGDADAPPASFEVAERAARSVGLNTFIVKVERTAQPDFESAFEAAHRQGVDAVLVLSTPVTTPHRQRIAQLAAQHRLPLLSPRDHADAGGLLSFGTSFIQATRVSAAYVDRILKGAKPAELPVQTLGPPELVINLRAARTLGIEIPPAVLAAATEVVP